MEAFFLVHATERESKPPVRDTRESQLSHIKDEPPPLSPAPLTPATPSSLDPFFSPAPSCMPLSSNLPPDTQQFLRFAGQGWWWWWWGGCREMHGFSLFTGSDLTWRLTPSLSLSLPPPLRDAPHRAQPDPAPVHHPPGRRALRRAGRLHPHPGLRRQAEVWKTHTHTDTDPPLATMFSPFLHHTPSVLVSDVKVFSSCQAKP